LKPSAFGGGLFCFGLNVLFEMLFNVRLEFVMIIEIRAEESEDMIFYEPNCIAAMKLLLRRGAIYSSVIPIIVLQVTLLLLLSISLGTHSTT
jgi:hypothetical protein